MSPYKICILLQRIRELIYIILRSQKKLPFQTIHILHLKNINQTFRNFWWWLVWNGIHINFVLQLNRNLYVITFFHEEIRKEEWYGYWELTKSNYKHQVCHFHMYPTNLRRQLKNIFSIYKHCTQIIWFRKNGIFIRVILLCVFISHIPINYL